MSKTKEISTGGNCKFGEPVSERVKCRRFPPSSDGKGHKSKDTQPMMMTEDWCGEHKVQ